jgi:hypothetical protein
VNAFLSELGGRLADRWAAALLGPGLLFLGAVTVAARLGQSSALNAALLGTWITHLADGPASHTAGVVLLVSAGVLGASTAAALVAAGLGRLIERAWLLSGRRGPARIPREWRQRRWTAAEQRVAREERAVADLLAARTDLQHRPASAAPLPAPQLGEALRRRDAICLVEPARPTWIADRLRAADERVRRAYGLDLFAAWPRLWTLASAELRSDVASAQESYTSAARLAGWSLLYLILACWWWPALLIGLAAGGAAWARARSAAEVLASLLETAADLHIADLAERLGMDRGAAWTPQAGQELSSRLRKDHRSHSIS